MTVLTYKHVASKSTAKSQHKPRSFLPVPNTFHDRGGGGGGRGGRDGGEMASPSDKILQISMKLKVITNHETVKENPGEKLYTCVP